MPRPTAAQVGVGAATVAALVAAGCTWYRLPSAGPEPEPEPEPEPDPESPSALRLRAARARLDSVLAALDAPGEQREARATAVGVSDAEGGEDATLRCALARVSELQAELAQSQVGLPAFLRHPVPARLFGLTLRPCSGAQV